MAIAFWVAGQGVPLIHLPWAPWSHVQLEWQNPDFHRWYERLSHRCQVVRYDGRGSGLSDRRPRAFDIEAQLRDLEAVMARLSLTRVNIFAPFNMGPAGITFAARHPDRVSHLMLWCAYARGEDYYSEPEVQAIRALLETDWDLYTETGAHSFVGWDEGEASHRLAHLMRDASTPEEAQRFLAEMRSVDCTSLLPTLRVPVLVMQPRELPLISLDLARNLASVIPDARLALFEGYSLAPQVVDNDAVASCVEDFVMEAGEIDPTSAQAPPDETKNPDGLTTREVEVLRLLAAGQSNREIAETLVISPRTVERHVSNTYIKINANNRVQASAYAFSHSIA